MFQAEKATCRISGSFWTLLPTDGPQCQHPLQFFVPPLTGPALAPSPGASPTLGPKQFPFPWAVLPSHTQRPGSAAPSPPRTPAGLWEPAPSRPLPRPLQPSAHVLRGSQLARSSRARLGSSRPSPPPGASRPVRPSPGGGWAGDGGTGGRGPLLLMM